MPRRRKRRRKRSPAGPADWAWRALFVLLLAAAGWLVWDQVFRPGTLNARLEERIDDTAHDHGLPPELVRAIVITESGGDPNARSSADARGLMQITPITHRDVIERFGLPPADDDKLYDPGYNLEVGTRYLAYLLKRFDDDLKLALAAYHMGPTAVARLRRSHPDLTTDELIALDGQGQVGPKTRAYVANVMRRTEMNNE